METRRKITRREAIKHGAGLTAGLAVVGAGRLAVAAKAPAGVVAVAKAAAIVTSEEVANDLVVFIRNVYANRCPLVTRLPWRPIERVDFPEPNKRQQFCQTFQFPVQVDGSAQARIRVMPDGIQSPFEFDQTVQLQNMVDDIENSCYYGIRQRPSVHPDDSVRAKMAGLRQLIPHHISGGDNNPSATLLGFRIAIEIARSAGGDPDLILTATDLLDSKRPYALEGISPVSCGETVFGTRIRAFACRELPGVTIVEAPLLRGSDAFVLSSSEVSFRNKQNPFWHLRGNRGEMVEGDWMAEGAIDVCNESHHAFVTSS